MGFWDNLFTRNESEEQIDDNMAAQSSNSGRFSESDVKAHSSGSRFLFSISYDGEKNTGELGPPVKYHLDYPALRWRSWQSYLDNKITQTVINKYVRWIVGSGLKLQSEPDVDILGEEGIKLDPVKFSSSVERRFRLWAKSKNVDNAGLLNLSSIAKSAYLNSLLGGDCLVLLRFKNKKLKVELIDGAHVQTPIVGNHLTTARNNGNDIINGIEQKVGTGEHVAYWVRVKGLKFVRFPAKTTRAQRTTAFLIYGLRYRINDNRGVPIISTVLQTLKQVDRYSEATVGSAEERAKIPYTVEHDQNSTGENPILSNVAQAFNADADQDIPIDINGQQMADKIAVSMNKSVYNMPPGASLKMTDTKSDINYSDFYSPNVNSICSAIGIPPEVALSKYDSNFSASRAALKDWEHTINVEREEFRVQFYHNIYSAWLDMEVMTSRIAAPGYVTAMMRRDDIILDSFRNNRFVGVGVPHIDPVKEVKAERLKLGAGADHIPLTTPSASTELLNGGEYDVNVKRFSEDVNIAKENGIEPKEEPQPATSGDGGGSETD